MSTLQQGSLLQGGRYKILSTIGQGGFGITYLALQSGLERKVAIKEFFMKDLCNRDEATSHVSVGSTGSINLVDRFRAKFLKEARNIAQLNHPNIVGIIDVFEENGTAYYVMEYAEGGSLADKLKVQGSIPEAEAVHYIQQIADALKYIHQQKMNHLDIKPANIMLLKTGSVILIDFGLSKQYDVTTGNQTSTTPVGISEGYAPMEQYRPGGVGEFSPETDVYSLGATLFKLLTGITPPTALDVYEEGVPTKELENRKISQQTIEIICKAMEGRKKDRMKDVNVFIEGLSISDKQTSHFQTQSQTDVKEDEVTVVLAESQEKRDNVIIENIPQPQSSEKQEGCHAEAEVRTFNVNGVSFDMILVKGGTFSMGNEEKGFLSGLFSILEDDRPLHNVVLTRDYYMGKSQVTQSLWKAVMGSNPSYFKGDDRPVERVSWNDCQEFISKLNEITGMKFRLPTEAEWEFAARGGNKSKHYKYSGSDNLDDVAWYDDNKNGGTHDVMTKLPNELGLFDMSGNVYEWCYDWFAYYDAKSQANPTGAASGSKRVNRGGCWFSFAQSCRLSSRDYLLPIGRHNNIGLRLALQV